MVDYVSTTCHTFDIPCLSNELSEAPDLIKTQQCFSARGPPPPNIHARTHTHSHIYTQDLDNQLLQKSFDTTRRAYSVMSSQAKSKGSQLFRISLAGGCTLKSTSKPTYSSLQKRILSSPARPYSGHLCVRPYTGAQTTIRCTHRQQSGSTIT